MRGLCQAIEASDRPHRVHRIGAAGDHRPAGARFHSGCRLGLREIAAALGGLRRTGLATLFVESHAVGTRPSARAYRAARGRRPYRRISYALVTPKRRRELGQLAMRTFERRYGGLGVLRHPDLLLLGRLLRGRTDAGGDLLSFLFFDREYVDALIAAGRRDARRWLKRHPGVWCADGAHDFDLAPVDAVREQDAASLDEYRSLRRV